MGERGVVVLLVVLALGLSLAAPAGAQPDPWWNSSFHYRAKAWVDNNNTARQNWPVEVGLNFTVLLQSAGCAGNCTFDPNSVRVVEYTNASGSLAVKEERPSQFDRDPDARDNGTYNNTTNAVGTVVWLLNGTTADNPSTANRTFYIYFDVQRSGTDSFPEFPPGPDSKPPPVYPTNITYNSSGEEFWVNTTGPGGTGTGVNVSTNFTSFQASGIYRLNFSAGTWNLQNLLNGAGGSFPVEYSRFYNDTYAEQTTFNMTGNFTFIAGAVRLTIQQEGPEVKWGDPTNATCTSCNGTLKKRYVFYNDTFWFKIQQIYTAKNDTNKSTPGTTGDGGPLPSSLLFNQTAAGWSTSPNSQDLTTFVSDPLTQTCFRRTDKMLNLINLEEKPDTFRASGEQVVIPAHYYHGIGLSATTVAANGTLRQTTVVVPSKETISTNCDLLAADHNGTRVRSNLSSPLNTALGAGERWAVNLTPRTEFGGADVSVFNRGETLNVTGRILNDAHLLNDSDGPQNATVTNASSNQDLGLAKVNDTNWSRSYTIATNADVSAPWNATLRINDSAGLLLNRSNRTFEVKDNYWVNVSNLTNYGSNPANASGFAILVNGSPALFNLSVHNYRWAPHVNQPGGYGIGNLGSSDVECRFTSLASSVNNSTATFNASAGDGNYTLNLSSNATLEAWNLSCFILASGPNTFGNYGNNTTLRYLTEPRGSFMNTSATVNGTEADSVSLSNITGTQNNSTIITITLNNTGLGHVFDVQLGITNLPAGWTVNSSAPLFSAAYVNNTTANRSNTLNFRVTVPANTSPGNYSLHVNTTWKNLEEKTWGNQTWDNGRTNNSSDILYINVTATPSLGLNTSRIVLGNLSHNTTTVFAPAFLLNSTGNDWLNDTLVTLNQANFTSGITVTFSKNNTNFPPNNTNVTGNNSVGVTVTLAKRATAGVYEGRFFVNATGSYGQCAAAPGSNCNATLNISLSINESAEWNTTDYTFNNSANPDRHLNTNTMNVATGDTNFTLGFLNVTSEANLNLSFSVNKTEQAGRTFVNLSAGGFVFNNSTFANFSLNTTDSPDFKNITLAYTIPGDFAGSSWVNITVNASKAGCDVCPANHTVNNSRFISFNFTLQAADLSSPSVFNVSVNGDNNTTTIPWFVFDAGRDTITIAANVTDVGTGVRDIWANISLPNGSWNNLTQLLQVSGSLYRNTFSVPALNGTYTLFIVAFDLNVPTANCAVNNSTSAGPCSPWPSGGFTFNATNTTNGSLEENPLLFEADFVVFPGGGQSFIVNTTFANPGPGGAYDAWLNVSIYSNNTTALAINGTNQKNESCGNVARGVACTRFFNVTALPQAFNGAYFVNTTLRWTNPNGSVNASVANSTTIRVWANPVLNLSNGTGASVEDRVVNVTVDHNTTNYPVPLRVLSNGNSPLINVTWNMTGVNASGSSISFAFNVSGFTSYPGADLLPGGVRDLLLNVTVPEKHPNGTWEFRFEANASNSTCVSVARCGKAFNLSVFVPASPTWTLNDSAGANVTCGSAGNQVEVNKASAELCAVRVNNTANVDLNFILFPASQFVNATEGSGNLSLNNSSFVIGRLGAARFFNVGVNTTGVTPGTYNFTLAVEARDNTTNTSAQPLRRNLTVNLTVFTKPLIALLNATTPNATAAVEKNYTDGQGRQVLIVEQGQPAVIYVNATDKSGSANATIQEVRADVLRPNGTSFLNVSTECVANCVFTTGDDVSTWRISIPGANLTLRGNHTANLTAVDSLGNPSDAANVTLRVKPKLFPVVNTSKTAGGTPTTTFGPSDNVFWNVYVTDLLGAPVAGLTASVVFRDPAGDPPGIACTTNVSSASTDAAGAALLRCKMSNVGTGTWTWNVTLNYTDATNNTTSINFSAGTLNVQAADLFVTVDPGGPWKPGDTMTATISTKDQNLQTLGVGAVTVRVEFYYPNSTLYLTNNSPLFLAGPELWSATLPLGTNIPFGTVGSPDSTYFAKAVANKTGSNNTVNDSKVVYVTDTLTATLSVGTPQFNNSTMNASFLVFRSGNVPVDPDSFTFNVSAASDAPLTGGNCAAPVNVTNISSPPANVQRLGTGFFLVQCQLQAAQPQGFYKANLTVSRKGITVGDLRAFEIALSSLDVNIEVLSTDVSDLSFRAVITNPGATGPVDITATWSVFASPPFAAGTQACQIRPFTTTTCPTIKVVPPGTGTYNIAITVAGPGVQTVNVLRQVVVGGGPPPPPGGPPGAPGGGGGSAGGGVSRLGGLERPALKVSAPREIDAVRGYRLNYTFTVENGGELQIPALGILLQGVPRSWWSVTSEDGSMELGRGQVKGFTLTLQIPPDAERGRLALTLTAEGQGVRDAASILLTIYGDWSELIPETMRRVNDTLAELTRRAQDAGASGANVSSALDLLGQAGARLERAREAYLNRDFAAASLDLERARTLLDRANAYLAAVPRAEPVPVAPQTVILGIVGVLASAAFGVAVWTGQIARSLSRTTRSLVLGPEARPALAGPPPPPGPPPSRDQAEQPSGASPAQKPPPADPFAERMNRARESTEKLLKSLQEQMEKGLISRERYEDLVRKIRR